MATLAAKITATGIAVPNYPDLFAQLKNAMQEIFGVDIDLDPDSQDGEAIAIFAQAVFDLNNLIVDAYNSFSPATAQGVGLSNVVKINGLRRLISTRSTAVVRLVGEVGTVIDGGVIGDNLSLNTVWDLPDEVVIPIEGQIDVTATCRAEGATTAAVGSLTQILTPTRGWQTVTNSVAATPGDPVEPDATLRRRQARSTSKPAQTILEAIYADLADLAGVERLRIYENDGDTFNDDGLPPHTICAVIDGGIAQEIGDTIAAKKPPGGGTFGNVNVLTVDQKGVPDRIFYQELIRVPVAVRVNITALAGFVSTTEDSIKQSVADFINGLDIGEDSYQTRLFGPANLNGSALAASYVVTAITQSRDGGSFISGNLSMSFKEAATCSADDVEVTVT
jgi:uncharacterized phage protein gp47/JayE